ncbi:B3 domain-containing transcription factor FUS3 isoform X2 [Cryptomeria japonica]|uniref:B3 domain-containing transcription factor FUS3 isoform X2 n=1 Tax=Cryptomeria japonica TaxID=3369 RepID=UPI0025AC03C0|nr:B3 domain-containing transcription factor FUS3 isoform X2 [Cryptomeria japonica]
MAETGLISTTMDTISSNTSNMNNIECLWQTATQLERSLYFDNNDGIGFDEAENSTIEIKSFCQPMHALSPSMENIHDFNSCGSGSGMSEEQYPSHLRESASVSDKDSVAAMKVKADAYANVRAVRKMRRKMAKFRRIGARGLLETTPRQGYETTTSQISTPCVPNSGSRPIESLKLQGGLDSAHDNPDCEEMKEAEANLPILTAKEGIQICMEEIHSCQTWNFKYRYWPNNKSRMYIMENTREFVKAHGLEPGDFVMLYKDEINDKYIIIAKKARSQLTASDSIDRTNLCLSSTLLEDGSMHQSTNDKDNKIRRHDQDFRVECSNHKRETHQAIERSWSSVMQEG